MDPARVAGTLWDVLYYVAGAVNRFLRPGPFNITSHDLLQDSTAESGSGGDGRTAGVCRDQSDEVAREPGASPPAWAGDKTQNAAIKAPERWSESAEDSAATFRSVTRLSRREKTTAGLENSSRPEGQEKMKNAEGEDHLSADHRPTDEQHARITTSDVNGEDDAPTHTAEMDTADIAVDLDRGSERLIKSTNVNGQSDAATGEHVGADEDRDEEEAEAESAQEMGKAFGNPPSRVCEASRRPHPPTCEGPLPERSDEAFPRANKTRGFPRVQKSEENPTRRDSRKEAESLTKRLAGETKATCATSEMGVKLPEGESGAPRSPTDGDTEDLQEGMEAVAPEHARRLRDAAGDDETGRQTLGFSRDKERMGAAAAEVPSGLGGGEMKPESCAVRDQRSEEVTKYGKDPLAAEVNRGPDETTTASDLRTTTTTRGAEETTPGSDSPRRDAVLDAGVPTAWPEGRSDSKHDDFSNESRCDAESFTIISSPESGSSDRSFGESRTAACNGAAAAANAGVAFAVEQAAAQEVLEMKSLEILKSDSEEEPAILSGRPGTKTVAQSLDKPESQLEVSSFVLNFAPQRSRMAVKNPRVRPPKDRRSLLLRRPPLPAGSPPPPQPASKIPVGVHASGAFRFGIQLPGLAAAFPVAKKLVSDARAKCSENSAGSAVHSLRASHQREAEAKAATKRAAEPPAPERMPPGQAGLGNPFMSELKTKLKKATKN